MHSTSYFRPSALGTRSFRPSLLGEARGMSHNAEAPLTEAQRNEIAAWHAARAAKAKQVGEEAERVEAAEADLIARARASA